MGFRRFVWYLRQLLCPSFPDVKLWEETQVMNSIVSQPASRGPLHATLDDPLCNWLWKQAWDACAETGNWDLLTAAAGIARGIRQEGVPLSDGLQASAVPYRAPSSEER